MSFDKKKSAKKIKVLNDRITEIEKRRRFEKSLAITLIGFFGSVISLSIDNIRGGSLNLPSDRGWLQWLGFGVCLIIFFWGMILLSKKK